jgi:hypothetical protein
MRPIAFVLAAAVSIAGIAVHESNAAKQTGGQAAASYVTKMPAGYRDYRFISVAHEAGGLNSLGAMLGNDVAIKAYRAKTLPFPASTIIAALHYAHSPNAETIESSARRIGAQLSGPGGRSRLCGHEGRGGRHMARAIAADLAPRNLRVNVVAPGAIKTPIWKRGSRASISAEQSPRWMNSSPQQFRWPLGRTGRRREGRTFPGFGGFVLHQCG